MRVAVVDLGTNSTRLLVADVEDGRVDEVSRRTEITRLGEIEWSYGFVARLLSGDEEGALTRRGVADGRTLDDGTLVLDVGGGSTELITAQHRTSLDLGSVRLTERHLRSDPPTDAELDAAARAVWAELPALQTDGAIGVAGTITTLAALELGRYDPQDVHGYRLSRAAVEAQLARLASLRLSKRRELPRLEPERAPVIVAGAVIVREVLDRYSLAALEVSERDLLHGAALKAAELPPAEEGDVPPGAYTCC